jgi:uncharacterized protein
MAKIPISSFVIKVASRCNLDCSYCYEYNMGDTSWKKMPKIIPRDVFTKSILRIKEHADEHKLSNISISLHGGEPLLAGIDNFKFYISTIKQILGNYKLMIGLQTNAILLDSQFVELFERERISVGISYDGPPAVNDKYRVYHNGKGSGLDVENGLSFLENKRCFSGILCVIDSESSALEVWRYLSSFNPPVIDFLLPHANWSNLPQHHLINEMDKFGNWFIEIFDDWYNGHKTNIKIRFFEEIIKRLLGDLGTLETLGVEPVGLITISQNGMYEQVDTMKSVHEGAHLLGMSVNEFSLNDLMTNNHITSRQNGIEGLSDTCKQCEIVNVCGGGYYPHRYSSNGSYENPSVYCKDLFKLISHIKSRVVSDKNVVDYLSKKAI